MLQILKDIHYRAAQAMLKEEQEHNRRSLPDDIKFIAGLPATYNQEREATQ